MLESYFVKPQTVDQVRASWIGAEIERYVGWLAERGYAARCVRARVPLLVAFGDFAWARGARGVGELPEHVESFVAVRVERFDPRRAADRGVAREVRGPLEQWLGLVVPGFGGGADRPFPFTAELPGFVQYLESERGLRPASIAGYRHHLSRLEAFLARIGVRRLSELSPAILSAFVAERAGSGLAKVTLCESCAVVRVFVRYAHRERVVAIDLSGAIEGPQVYRLSDIPRSITWDEVGQVLAGVDRRTPCGKRDWAILLLLVTYGLRSREIAALTLDHIDWRRERLAVPERKGGALDRVPAVRLGRGRAGGLSASRAS